MNDLFKKDLYRIYGEKGEGWHRCTRSPVLKQLKIFRKIGNSKGILRLFYRLCYKRYEGKTRVLLPLTVQAGGGLCFWHGGPAVINENVVFGKNVTIMQYATIGAENRGKRKGAPQIGDEVYIGAGASVVGNITIGNDVLIAPNAYVNFDVPSHSIVLGNPGKIISRQNATEGYIGNKVD